ncbi:phosphoglycerate kinase [Neoehrlichia mikurensis]|uniref:phosphoglycerate kinase n=1 Tax=Neoehrlichia mikurensis TaxID=89586 RepID=A0A9Q9BW08_9RICK|nr:phosphoglycerate kinase [Neoehrlichia mikurensis]QXK92301.1 phosphoglycerate kinase [Neoehrlichia mikurensis]QXK92755.1 phosphoglycerate kinase [Neoehrlichia mikurensis]QXK93996.1 phosphoglycerate kinase [Neoehrlichia mikurensis]UTO55841.1 phosphoglycerate kinase [Neoehrlichia mikurensis]UTO56756.1 phosphoglycerate kinase [Neoehrlichia mikurensis]
MNKKNFYICSIRKMQDFNFYKKIVILRADLNVPVVNGLIQDSTRIVRLIPTINYLLQHNAKIIIASHFGRPKTYDKKFSLGFLTDVISNMCQQEVLFISENIGMQVRNIVCSSEKSIFLLENLRFNKGEEENDDDFARQLSLIADVYVNDAFSCFHRQHASINAITKFLPSFIGLNFQQEIQYLSKVVSDSSRPIAAIVGGAKISTKVSMLKNIASKIDFLILGGAIANNFLLIKEINIGKSLCETISYEISEEVINIAQQNNCKIILPIDCITAKSINSDVCFLKDIDKIEHDDMILDIGGNTLLKIKAILEKCNVILWNGPVGAFEYEKFSRGTFDLTRTLVDLKKKKVNVIVGGGDSISAIKAAGFLERDFTYISTGGGALLHFLSIT